MRTERRRSPLLLLLPLLALIGLGIHLSRAQAPGSREPTRSRREDADRAAKALAPPEMPALARALTGAGEDPAGENGSDGEASTEPPPPFPDSPELRKLAQVAGHHIGERLRFAFDIETFVHGEEPGPLKRIEVSAETIDQLLGLLDADDARLRRDAAIRLSAAVLRPQDLALLRAALEDELREAREAPSRHTALALSYALAAQGDASGTRRIEAEALGGARQEDPAFRREAAIVLGMIADPESSETLRTLLRDDPEPDTRQRAAQSLARIGGDDNRQALADSLSRDVETGVRAWASLAYGRAAPGDGSGAEPLRDAARSDAEPVVRAASNYALSRAAGPTASLELMDAFHVEADTLPRVGAIAGLARIPDLPPEQRTFLEETGAPWLAGVARESEDDLTVFVTVRTLERLGGSEPAPAMLAVVDSGRADWVRAEAVRAYARKAPEEAVAALEARIASEKSERIRGVMEAEIDRLDNRHEPDGPQD
jgi:HEAT repeat protein